MEIYRAYRDKNRRSAVKVWRQHGTCVQSVCCSVALGGLTMVKSPPKLLLTTKWPCWRCVSVSLCDILELLLCQHLSWLFCVHRENVTVSKCWISAVTLFCVWPGFSVPTGRFKIANLLLTTQEMKAHAGDEHVTHHKHKHTQTRGMF